MKRYFILFFLAALLIGCSEKPTPSEIVTEYYDAFNSSDFNRIAAVIADSITIIDGEYVIPYSVESFHKQFKWDSIFQPTYDIVELEDQKSQIIATVASSSKRYKFLENDPLICSFRISFDANKITMIEALEYTDADWNLWQANRDSLVNWTSRNHPELDGFIHDLTMDGAKNYLKAIDLYEKRKEESL